MQVDARIAELRAAAAAGRRQEATDGLLALEKQGRVAEDITSTRKACSALLEVSAGKESGWWWGTRHGRGHYWHLRGSRRPPRSLRLASWH